MKISHVCKFIQDSLEKWHNVTCSRLQKNEAKILYCRASKMAEYSRIRKKQLFYKFEVLKFIMLVLIPFELKSFGYQVTISPSSSYSSI